MFRRVRVPLKTLNRLLLFSMIFVTWITKISCLRTDCQTTTNSSHLSSPLSLIWHPITQMIINNLLIMLIIRLIIPQMMQICLWTTMLILNMTHFSTVGVNLLTSNIKKYLKKSNSIIHPTIQIIIRLLRLR